MDDIKLYSTDNRRMSERDPKAMMAHAQQLPNSKSVPTLHHVGNSGKYNTSPNFKSVNLHKHKRSVSDHNDNDNDILNNLVCVCLSIGIVNNKSRSIHNLTGNTDQSFYQNLSVYRAQNQSQPNLGDRYVSFKNR